MHFPSPTCSSRHPPHPQADPNLFDDPVQLARELDSLRPFLSLPAVVRKDDEFEGMSFVAPGESCMVRGVLLPCGYRGWQEGFFIRWEDMQMLDGSTARAAVVGFMRSHSGPLHGHFYARWMEIYFPRHQTALGPFEHTWINDLMRARAIYAVVFCTASQVLGPNPPQSAFRDPQPYWLPGFIQGIQATFLPDWTRRQLYPALAQNFDPGLVTLRHWTGASCGRQDVYIGASFLATRDGLDAIAILDARAARPLPPRALEGRVVRFSRLHVAPSGRDWASEMLALNSVRMGERGDAYRLWPGGSLGYHCACPDFWTKGCTRWLRAGGCRAEDSFSPPKTRR
ncbi:hypothetical protein PsYK624_063510 [Phanerochaete sordida]|uniref:Uncharacterized protein n=1 Tax=Phanerochaete sordida TaxID=48140 RepID=A0A9P3G9D2_9APHY|nr:hypothetical protein PsYK624_063510 [Phanerochaete sordida]